jgi:hypothetical protein
MKYTLPSREDVISVLQELIEGKRSPIDVGLWAVEIDRPENKEIGENLRATDPVLQDMLNTLSLAAQKGDGDNMLYGTEDFKEWLKEFESDSAKS